MSKLKSVCLITSGLAEKNLRLQPWRYLYEVASQLSSQGHAVTVVSDASPDAYQSKQLESNGSQNGANGLGAQKKRLAIKQVSSINRYRWQQNSELDQTIAQADPDVLLWHLGLPSFVHQQLSGWEKKRPVVGIFPGLVYGPNDFYQLGLSKVIRGYKLSAIHVLGSMVPKGVLRGALKSGSLQHLVTQTETTRQNLLEKGLRSNQIQAIGPGIDPIWSNSTSSSAQLSQELRQEMGFTSADTVIIYFGSPAPLRGLHSLIKALKVARIQNSSLKLLILNRRHADDLMAEDAELRELLTSPEVSEAVHLVTGFLEPNILVQHVAAADVVALPFELVPADAPLSILEAHALGKPVITTTVASLPELAANGTCYLAKPADITSLAEALLKASSEQGITTDGVQVDEVSSSTQQQHQTTNAVNRDWTEVGIEWSQLIQAL